MSVRQRVIRLAFVFATCVGTFAGGMPQLCGASAPTAEPRNCCHKGSSHAPPRSDGCCGCCRREPDVVENVSTSQALICLCVNPVESPAMPLQGFTSSQLRPAMFSATLFTAATDVDARNFYVVSHDAIDVWPCGIRLRHCVWRI